MIKAADPGKPLPEVEPPEAIILRRGPQLDATGMSPTYERINFVARAIY